MGEDFEAGVCSSTWWNLPKSPLGYWPSGHDHLVEMSNARSSDDSGGSVVSDQQPDSCGGVWMDSSTLEMMGINGISSPTSATTTTDWNHTLFGRSGSDYNSRMIQEDMNPSLSFGQETGLDCPSKIQKEWTSDTTSGFNHTNHEDFSLDHQSSHGLIIPSMLLQTLFDSTDPQPQRSLFDNGSTKYSDEFPPLEKFSPLVLKGSFTKQPVICNPLNNLTTTAPFWNTSNASVKDVRTSFLPSFQTRYLASTFEEKSSCPNLIAKANNEGVQDSCKRTSGGPVTTVFKRPRIETPSPLPTFKVRKEKLGDRITALQQLVSPFGKTDTASVLQEAIEYIKFLHDQVNVLSTPYMKNGAPEQHEQMFDNVKNNQETKQDLRSRGLCLVPISSTFPVANETPIDFWTPTFGGTYR